MNIIEDVKVAWKAHKEAMIIAVVVGLVLAGIVVAVT